MAVAVPCGSALVAGWLGLVDVLEAGAVPVAVACVDVLAGWVTGAVEARARVDLPIEASACAGKIRVAKSSRTALATHVHQCFLPPANSPIRPGYWFMSTRKTSEIFVNP